jgi:hypothetical protein
MYLNKECIYPNLSDLFIIKDVTDEVNSIIQQIPADLKNFKSLILEREQPNVLIGPHCSEPYDCLFIDYCWSGFGNMTVFEIPRIYKERQLELREKGILTIDKLPRNYPLSEAQHEYVRRILKKEINIDKGGIRQRLSELEYPLYFLDFETFNPAIPRFNGMSPYNQFPFQYSCHVMQDNGDIGHFGYLHLDETDPRKPLIEFLLASIAKIGSVICYSVGFEKGVLTGLADAFPAYSKDLNSIAKRLWDQKNIFDYYYRDFRFGNSISLKSVVPVLVPRLSYEKLAIHGGTEAQVVWEQIINTEDNAEKGKMIEDLKAYCKMDTLAMVKIHNHLLNESSLD